MVGELATSNGDVIGEDAMAASIVGGASSSKGDAQTEVPIVDFSPLLGTEEEEQNVSKKKKKTGPLRGAATEVSEAEVTTDTGAEGGEDTGGESEWEAEESCEAPPVKRCLRDEANSVTHYLLHRPGLPQHCQECRWAKTKRKKRFCSPFKREFHRYGEQVSADHVYFKDIYQVKGVEGYSEGLTFLDRCTNFRGGQPVQSRDHADTEEALRFLKGTDSWEVMYSDNEPSLRSTCKSMAVTWEPCQPGIHNNNGVIENTNLQIVYDIKVTLATGGLPACMWPYALAYCCLIHNLIQGEDGFSPWMRKFGEEFQGTVLPMGCGVFFLPAPTKYKNSKAAPSMSYGVVAGYRLAPGSRWNGQYLIMDITDFVGQSLHIDTPGTEFWGKTTYHGTSMPWKEGGVFPTQKSI
jgi:hypothetical protein